MKRFFSATAISIGLIVLIAGCENPFSGNVFASFATPDAPEGAADIESIVAEGGVDALIDELAILSQSDDFYANLIAQDLEQQNLDPNTPSALDQILEELGNVYTNEDGSPIADATEEEVAAIRAAALAAAEIELQTSSGAEVANSLVTVAFGLIGGDEGGEGEGGTEGSDIVTDVIESAFGALSADDFTETLSSLQNAAVAFEAFGNTIDVVTDENGDVVSVDSPPDVNIESVAQNAVVAIALSEIVTAYEADNPGETIDSQEELLALTEAASDTENPDYAASKATIDAAMDALDANTAFDNILVASGLADLFSFGDEEEVV